MVEPCSALDPIATRKIEEWMLEVESRYFIAIVTHNPQQQSTKTTSAASSARPPAVSARHR